MKLSSYYKQLGWNVELKLDYENLDTYDKVTISKVFMDTGIPFEPEDKSMKTEKHIADFYKDNPILNLPNVQYGGTGFYYDKSPRLKEDIDTSDDWNWQNIKSYMKSETSESTSVLAYAFYLHFITFFNSYQSIISKRKIKDSPSKREKQLIGDLIFFTGIIQNESISTDPDYLKTLIKRYKDYQLPNGTFTY